MAQIQKRRMCVAAILPTFFLRLDTRGKSIPAARQCGKSACHSTCRGSHQVLQQAPQCQASDKPSQCPSLRPMSLRQPTCVVLHICRRMHLGAKRSLTSWNRLCDSVSGPCLLKCGARRKSIGDHISLQKSNQTLPNGYTTRHAPCMNLNSETLRRLPLSS